MAISVSLMIEGQQGLTWERWQRLADVADTRGFAGLFRSDHFTDPQPPNRDSLELVVSLAYLATNTRHIHFGPCVAPVSFRDPIMFARQAMAIDDLSGGRMILGLGAGWQEREHALFGYPLGDVTTRMDRFEEALEVVSRLVRQDNPQPFDGEFYYLGEGAQLLPRPGKSGGPKIMIGGNGPRRTMPLAARYADIWNGVFINLDTFRERSAHLDRLLDMEGRERGAVKRTLMTGVHFGRDEAELAQVIPRREGSFSEQAAQMRERGLVVGGAQDMAEYLQRADEAGVEEVFLQWIHLDDIERLEAFADAVRPWLTPAK